MHENREQLWQAYVDAELSVTEAAEFEVSLTEVERGRLADDMQFERVLAERLSHEAECPDEVWERTKARVLELGETPVRIQVHLKRWYWGAATLATAAALAFVISLFAASGGTPDRPTVILAASSVEELAASSEIEPGSDSAEQFLHEKGVQLHLVDDGALETLVRHHSGIHFIGARQESLEGDPVTEVFVECCGLPVKVLLASLDSNAANRIGVAAAQNGDIQATRVIGDYLAAVVSRHESHGLLDMLSE